MRFQAICLAPLLALAACSSSSNAPTEGTLYGSCTNVDASPTCETVDAGYAPVRAILAKSCLPACHDGSPDAAWPLTEYDDVQAWTNFVAEDLLRCTMPPINSGYPMSRKDRETILQWIICGAPP